MSLKDLWNILKKKDPRANHIFTEDDQKKSQEVKQAMHDIKMRRLDAERARADYELAKYENKIIEEFGDEDEGSNNELAALQTILTPFFTKSQQGNNGQQADDFYSPPTNNSPAVVQNNITDEDIKSFISSQPKAYIQMAKKAPKNMVIQQSMNKMGLTEQQALRAYDILQEEF